MGKALGQLFRSTMAEKGYTGRQLAEEVGVSEGRISQILGGDSLRDRLKAKIARALDLTEYDILNADVKDAGSALGVDVGANDLEILIIKNGARLGLSRKEEDALLGVYGAFAGRDSLYYAKLLRHGSDSEQGDGS
jgi:transcriptional regulator with XRE-family HTH domain